VLVSRRTEITGSALIRLLARLTDITVPESRQGFADRLSRWFGWTDAITLSAALDGHAAAAPAPRGTLGADERDCTGVRGALAKAIGDDDLVTVDFASYRRRYIARQQAMEAAIGPLRGRLRARLAARSPSLARLASMDALMEQVLGVQEHNLLATLPATLEKHFVHLRQAEPPTPDATEGEAGPGPWVEVFRRDMQAVLLAELDIRFQPLEGLLAALRNEPTKPSR
jgi:hypothetical protein